MPSAVSYEIVLVESLSFLKMHSKRCVRLDNSPLLLSCLGRLLAPVEVEESKSTPTWAGCSASIKVTTDSQALRLIHLFSDCSQLRFHTFSLVGFVPKEYRPKPRNTTKNFKNIVFVQSGRKKFNGKGSRVRLTYWAKPTTFLSFQSMLWHYRKECHRDLKNYTKELRSRFWKVYKLVFI